MDTSAVLPCQTAISVLEPSHTYPWKPYSVGVGSSTPASAPLAVSCHATFLARGRQPVVQCLWVTAAQSSCLPGSCSQISERKEDLTCYFSHNTQGTLCKMKLKDGRGWGGRWESGFLPAVTGFQSPSLSCRALHSKGPARAELAEELLQSLSPKDQSGAWWSWQSG